MNEEDIRMVIRRSIARDPPRKKIQLTRMQMYNAVNKFTPAQVYRTTIPVGFKGTKLEYLIYNE